MASVASADISRLAEALRKSGTDSRATTMSVLQQASGFLLSEMEARAAVDTGAMRKSLGVRLQGDKVIVGPDVPYAKYVEWDTRPHDIRPKTKKALAFKVNGTTVIVKKVHHPGTKAQPFVRPAFEAWVESLGEMAAEANIKVITDATD